MNASGAFVVAPATPDNVPQLVALIRALAEFERLTHLLECTEQQLHQALFTAPPAVEAVMAWCAPDPQPVGFALYFHNYSTFLGRRGLYLEDLYVRPDYRGRGCGTALLRHLARLACERACGRFEWSVLDWNTQAQRFYQRLGADVLPEWRIVRLSGEALVRLGGHDGGKSA